MMVHTVQLPFADSQLEERTESSGASAGDGLGLADVIINNYGSLNASRTNTEETVFYCLKVNASSEACLLGLMEPSEEVLGGGGDPHSPIRRAELA
jgi:hypothetical protein